MRIVLDTNVFVSGIFWSGRPSHILDAWSNGEFGIIVTPAILTEYRRVAVDIAGKVGFDGIAQILNAIQLNAEILDDTSLAKPVCRDPDDDKFLAAAIAGGADCVVSGDKDLLSLEEFEEIPIVSAHRFLTLLANR